MPIPSTSNANIKPLLQRYNWAERLVWVEDIDLLPKSTGVYVLLMVLDKSKKIQVGAKGKLVFKSGYYLYIGSARGSGGLKARVGRHFKNDATKKLRWHIDYIRAHMSLLGCWVLIEKTNLSTTKKTIKSINTNDMIINKALD